MTNKEYKARLRIKWKEALDDPSKMTPSLSKSLTNYRERHRRSAKKQYKIMRLAIETEQQLTPTQARRRESLNRSKTWRALTPKNEEKYRRISERQCENMKLKRAARKNPNNNIIKKRGLDSNINLNAVPAEYNEFYDEQHPVQIGKSDDKKTLVSTVSFILLVKRLIGFLYKT